MRRPGWFPGPLMAGFECATYVRRDGVRLDLLASTRHDVRAAEDYRLCARHGMHAVRDGLVWHRICPAPGTYDWSSFDAMVAAARGAGVRVIWDLLHFGWPDWTNPHEPGFVEHFAEFARLAARRAGSDAAFIPINEISFLSWGCGEDGFMRPHLQRRGVEIKFALCAAFIAAARAIRAVDPAIPIMTAEPLIAVHPHLPEQRDDAAWYEELQWQSLDFILGREAPWLGGDESLVDVVGLNHYPQSQWTYGSRGLPLRRRALAPLLLHAQARYGRPIFLAETGAEGAARAPWFRYVMNEVAVANAAGANVVSTCLYPILNHLGWQDDRYCPNGLFCGVGEERAVHAPLAAAIAAWRADNEPPARALAA